MINPSPSLSYDERSTYLSQPRISLSLCPGSFVCPISSCSIALCPLALAPLNVDKIPDVCPFRTSGAFHRLQKRFYPAIEDSSDCFTPFFPSLILSKSESVFWKDLQTWRVTVLPHCGKLFGDMFLYSLPPCWGRRSARELISLHAFFLGE